LPPHKRKLKEDGLVLAALPCDSDKEDSKFFIPKGSLVQRLFTSPTEKKRVKREEAGEKPFQCSLCDYSASAKGQAPIQIWTPNLVLLWLFFPPFTCMP
jgi:hypothetical protein